jgi:hypothetical protein
LISGFLQCLSKFEDEAIFSKFLIDEQKNYAGVVYILEALSLKEASFISADSGSWNSDDFGG